MKTARFALTESCYLRQAGQEVPVFIGADPAHPVVVVLDADTKERQHLKRLAEDEQPRPETLLPAHAGIVTGGNALTAAQHYSARSALPIEGAAVAAPSGRKGRAADRD